MRHRRAAVVLAALVLASGLTGPAAGASPADRVRIEVPDGESLLVHGEYPPLESSCVAPRQPLLHERYKGAVEILRASDGSLTVIGELPFEEYLKGIAEVPRDWPAEALKAQVVAARSYATVQIAREDASLYDLCATDACQVYQGLGVEAGAWGDRWVRAVEETAGEVLLYEGEPAETFYFSTSNGRTYTNAAIWGSDPLPYLPGVAEGDDGGSPLSEWRVEVPFDDLERFLGGAGWSGGEIERVKARRDGAVVVSGGGSHVVADRSGLRDALNAAASCLAPERYPPTEPDGYRLPQTVPSTWFDASVEGRSLVLQGRGWGHGVGMVQWGAKGKADRGLAYADILASYYGGLRPQRSDVPGTIRVLLASGLRSATLAPSGKAEVAGPARVPDAPWELHPAGAGVRLRRGAEPSPLLELAHLRAVRAPAGPVRVGFEASRNLLARIEFLSGEDVVGATPLSPHEDGRVTLAGEAPPGTDRLRVWATDGVDTVVTEAVRPRPGSVEPSAPASPTAEASPEAAAPATPGDDDAGGGLPIAGAAVLALVALLVVLAARRRRVP